MTKTEPIDDVEPIDFDYPYWEITQDDYLERELFKRFAENDRLGYYGYIHESTLWEAVPDEYAGFVKNHIAKLITRTVYHYKGGDSTDLKLRFYGDTEYPVMLFTESDPDHPNLQILRTLAETVPDEPLGSPEYVTYDALASDTGIHHNQVVNAAFDLADAGVVEAHDTKARLALHSAPEAWDVLKQYDAVD